MFRPRTSQRARKPLLLFEFLALAISSQVLLGAQEVPSAIHPRGLSGSTQRVLFESGAFTGPSTPLPQWGNGYLVSREIETFRAGVPNVRLYDSTGKLVREAAIWFPESQRVLIYSATATSDGGIIVGGKAEKADGSAGPFIALVTPTGKMSNVIQTKSFFPVNVCQAPDGTVWSFGGTGYDEHSEPKQGDTLRHIDFLRGELGSYLPRSKFPKHPGPEILGYIHCSANEVVAYSTSAREYVEMKYGDAAPHVYHADIPSGLRLSGFAIIGPKRVYGYFHLGEKGGIYYLSFDEAANIVNWLPLEGTVGVYTRPGVIIGLWGSDGDKLIVSRAEDGAGQTALHWVTPLEQ